MVFFLFYMIDLFKMLSRCVYFDVDGVFNMSVDGGVIGVYGWWIILCVFWFYCVLDFLWLEDFMYIIWKMYL